MRLVGVHFWKFEGLGKEGVCEAIVFSILVFIVEFISTFRRLKSLKPGVWWREILFDKPPPPTNRYPHHIILHHHGSTKEPGPRDERAQ